jgi:hypothetical protein
MPVYVVVVLVFSFDCPHNLLTSPLQDLVKSFVFDLRSAAATHCDGSTTDVVISCQDLTHSFDRLMLFCLMTICWSVQSGTIPLHFPFAFLMSDMMPTFRCGTTCNGRSRTVLRCSVKSAAFVSHCRSQRYRHTGLVAHAASIRLRQGGRVESCGHFSRWPASERVKVKLATLMYGSFSVAVCSCASVVADVPSRYRQCSSGALLVRPTYV